MVWNQWQTDAYNGMLAETVVLRGYHDDWIHGYFARPLGSGPFPSLVLIPHMPGWDELNREVARRFAEHGYLTLCPNIYERFGHGLPAEIAAKARSSGGVPDDSVLGDCESAISYLKALPNASGKVGVIGMCSGGRHAFLAGCRLQGIDAVVDCWGGGVVAPKERLSPAQPVAPVDFTEQLSCPLLGIFGNDDQYPAPDQVDTLEAALKKFGKQYAFHRYDGAGHAMWYYDGPNYRPAQAVDSWEKVFAFFDEHVKGQSE